MFFSGVVMKIKFVYFVVVLLTCVWCSQSFLQNGIFATGNTLWDELYQKCGQRVTFYCVQSKLMNYINDTLDSDLHITEGIYFAKSKPLRIFSRKSKMDAAMYEFDDGEVDASGTRTRFQRAINMSNSHDNEPSNKNSTVAHEDTDNTYDNTDKTPEDIHETQENILKADDEEEEMAFTNFVHTVEQIDDDLVAVKSAEGVQNVTRTSDNSTDSEQNDESRSDNFVVRSLSKVTDLLYDKTTAYLSSHDLHLDLPQTFFGGSRMLVSPKGMDEDGGILLKLNFSPAETPRGIMKYFHKMFKKKLLTSFLALLLIIKLIKVKIMYVLPVIIGVNAAKKILLKTLLFLFPPLVHLFKLCTYYHAHAAKLHFHHHKIKHHHHHIKVPVPVPVPVPSHKPYTPYDLHSHHSEYDGPGSSAVDHESPSYDGGSPSYGVPEYYTRNDVTNQHGDELDSWGLKDYYATGITESPGVLSAQAQAYSPYAEHNYKILQGAASNRHVSVSKDPYKKNKISAGNSWKTKSGNYGSSKNTFLTQHDTFYSPILQKIDSIFTQLGFIEEGCRERLICSMYKNPSRYSPHSNLLSSELSRDPTELDRPSPSNPAAVRFYRYVEAARDGQSQKDCLILYSDCAVKTE